MSLRLAILSAALAAAWAGCPKEWPKFNRRCFWPSNDTKSWLEAKRYCYEILGDGVARLVFVKNRKTNRFLTEQVLRKDRRYWIGLRRKRHHAFQWVGNATGTYNNAPTGLPVANYRVCIFMDESQKNENGALWGYTTHCDRQYLYVCDAPRPQSG